MDRYAFLADLVTLAADCVGNAAGGCQYEVFVSPGEPPADCSHVAAYWTGSAILPGSDKCLIKTRETFAVSLNRCCLKNIGEEFDAGLEDDDARCFVTDFGAMFECLVCGIADVLKPYVRTCQDVIVKIAQPDRTASGGCYGGVVEISFVRLQPCCAPPAPPSGPQITSVAATGVCEEITVSGTGLDQVTSMKVYYNGGASNITFWPLSGNPLSEVLQSPLLGGETVTAVEGYSDYPPTALVASLGSLSVAVAACQQEFDVQYNCITDEVVVTSNLGYDFSAITTINYTGNGSGQIMSPTHYTIDSPSQITIQNASFILNGGTLTQLDFLVGGGVWDGSVDLTPC